MLFWDREVTGEVLTACNGKALTAAQTALDALAASLAVTPLSNFVRAGIEEVSEFHADEGLDTDEMAEAMADLPPTEWVEPAEGLATVSALLQRLREEPHQISNQERVVKALDQLHRLLVAAQKQGARFHLSLYYVI